MLARGEDAIRQRLARLALPAGNERARPLAVAVANADTATVLPEVAPTNAASPAASLIDGAGTVPHEPPVAIDASVIPGPMATAEPAPPLASALPFATLTAFDRILAPSKQRDRTFFIALGIVFGLHLAALVGALELGEAVPDLSQNEKRGQVEKSSSIEVEFVEAPSETAAAKPSQQGENVKPTPPAPQAPPQQAQPEQQEVKEAKAEPVPEKPPEKPQEREKPKEKPLSVDDFDVSLNDYAKAVERAQAQRKQDRQEAVRSHERVQEFGAAPVGKQSAYSRATLAMLSRTKPELFITRGQVYVRFELDRAGKVKLLQVVKSSNDTLLDSTIVDWLKRAKYEVPPPDATMEDLVYDINFTVR